MHFLVDAQLPPTLVLWIEAQGHSARHVADLGLDDAEDLDVWRQACADGTSLITKDSDFVAIRNSLHAGPAVVWLRIGNASNRALIAWLGQRWASILLALDAGSTIIEVR